MDKCILCGMQSGIDWHHTVPQAYGGVNSKQVPLCSGHHTQVHTMALALYKHGDEGQLDIPQDVPQESQAEMMVLVRTIVIARRRYEAAKDSRPDLKKGRVTVNLDANLNQKVDRLKHLLNLSSKEEVMKLAINRLFQSQTQKAKSKQ